MGCPHAEGLSNAEYLERFNRKAAELRIPLSGSLELTWRCNLRCIHCYHDGLHSGHHNSQDNDQHGDHRHDHRGGRHGGSCDPTPPPLDPRPDRNGGGPPGAELPTERWLSILDEIADAGCLYLMLTGGEPLLREGFADIYRHSRIRGMLVTVFTNGTLVTKDIVELFGEYPPQAVEVSLYGACDETHDRITSVPGSFRRTMEGIRLLQEAGVRVKLKSILMTCNQKEFHGIETIARDRGLKFRFDAAIFPRFHGDKSPLELRVPPEEAVEMEFADPERARNWLEYHERQKLLELTDKLYQCGAGLTSFHVDPSGSLSPCLMAREPSYDLSSGNFKHGWTNVIPLIRYRTGTDEYNCNHCERRALCGFCPAFFKLENGAEDIPSGYLCALGQKRLESVKRLDAVGT